VEDFVGATPRYPATWPEIAIDTALLHRRYDWQGSLDPLRFPFYPFLPDPGALPQVGWCILTPDAEVLYSYLSCYGEEPHPFEPTRDFHGRPVMVRVEREDFRSVHSVFTPLALDETTGQQMVDSVLNWLYEKWLPPPASGQPTDIVGASDQGGAR
jgi:hypothetical protein